MPSALRGGRRGVTTLPKPATHTLRAADGWRLSVLDYAPAGTPAGVVVAGHAMMADRRTLAHPDRPSLAGALVDAGLRVLVPDLRGHGASGPTPREGGRWGYDDLVADTAIYLELARGLDAGPVTLLGHSLFGHTALAWLGRHPDAPVAAFAAVGVGLWARRFEPSPLLWAAKASVLRLSTGLVRAAGHLPARRLRIGPADEAPEYWRDLCGFAFTGRWHARDGFDYHAGLEAVRCPVLHVSSDGDRLLARPAAALAFGARLPHRHGWRLGPGGDLPELAQRPPDHMGLVTSTASQPLWRAVAAWLRAQASAAT